MLYLYTIMMFAWDLDPDTHSHFREYLDVFINKRKISKELKEFVEDTRSRLITSGICWTSGYEKKGGWIYVSVFDELRINLPYRVFSRPSEGDEGDEVCAVILEHEWPKGPKRIEDIHPPKYYHNAKKLSPPPPASWPSQIY